MPRRPRQHQIEDESRNAFRSALPKQWVFRDTIPDYGIDGEVEIFDERGVATGLLFKVQLKSTDKVTLKEALAIRLTKEADQYYRSLDLPTLIVAYHAPAKCSYARWFHTFDPYYQKRGKKTVTIRLEPEDKWSDETPLKIVNELRIFKRFNSSVLPLPISFTLVVKNPVIHGVPAPHITSALRKAAEELGGVVSFTTVSPQHAHPRIVIENDKTLVDLAGLKTATYHTHNKYPKDQATKTFPFDVLLFVAVVLFRCGHAQAASRIVMQCAEKSDVIRFPQIAVELTACLVRAQRFSEALKLSDKILDVKGDWFGSQILAFAPYLQSEILSNEEANELVSFLERRVRRAEEFGDPAIAAVAHYNLGHMLRGLSGRRALHHYRKAAELDAGYLEREYFYRELGAMFFNSRRFDLASKFYKKALEKGAEKACTVLYADALMFSGQYLESEKLLNAFLGSEDGIQDDWTPEWRLKKILLSEIRNILKVDHQKRQEGAANRQLQHAVKSFSHELMPAIQAALALDALCWLAWADLARIHMSQNDVVKAFLPFLAVSLILRNECESWCWAILTGLVSSTGQSFVEDMVITAYLINGERFVEGVRTFSENLPQQFQKEDFLQQIDEIVSKQRRPSSPTVVRVLGKGGSYQIFTPKRSIFKP